jgi:cobalamin biosynthesis Mg chelatase CobN
LTKIHFQYTLFFSPFFLEQSVNVEAASNVEQADLRKRAIYNLNGHYAEAVIPVASVGPNAYSALDIASAAPSASAARSASASASAAPSASMKPVLKARRSALESAKASHRAAASASASASAPSSHSIVSIHIFVYIFAGIISKLIFFLHSSSHTKCWNMQALYVVLSFLTPQKLLKSLDPKISLEIF